MSFSNTQLIEKCVVIKLQICKNNKKYVIFKYVINKKYVITIDFMIS